MKVQCGEIGCKFNHGPIGRKQRKCKKKKIHLNTVNMVRSIDILKCRDYEYEDPCPPDISLKELKKKLE